jgi:hypothetical protein
VVRALAVALGLSVAAVAQAGATDLAEMQDRSAFIARRYLEIWSANDGSPIAGVPYMYGPTVQFYGRRYTRAMLVDEKRRTIRQWPVRRYAHRPGTLRVSCNAATQKCAARSIIDFEARNPARGTVRRGSARFDLGISFAGATPLILYEDGTRGRRS